MENLYDHRTPLQIVALGVLSAAAATGVGLAFQRLRGSAGGIMATCGAILSLCCWCAEVISLHAFDTVLYCQVGGVMLVSLCWVTCALMTGLGILWDFRAARADA